MKDSGIILREKIMSVLNERFKYKGRKVMCYDGDAVPIEAKAPYIIMNDIVATSIGAGDKDSFANDVSVLMEVVTKFRDGVGGRRDADLIGNEVKERLITFPSNYLDLSPNFYIVTAVLESSSYRNEQVADGKITRKLIRIRYNIQEQ